MLRTVEERARDWLARAFLEAEGEEQELVAVMRLLRRERSLFLGRIEDRLIRLFALLVRDLKPDNGAYRIPVASQEEIGQQIGATREGVSRALANLARRGIVLRLREPGRLRRLRTWVKADIIEAEQLFAREDGC